MSESRKAKEEYLASEDARRAKLGEEEFTFDEFRDHTARHETFMEKIHEGIEFYCKKMDIQDPTEGYGCFYADADAVLFEIDELGCNIKYADDIGTCGDTDMEERSLYIPIEYFDLDTRETVSDRKAQERKDEITRLNEKLKNDKMNHTTAYNKCRDIQSDQHKLQDMNRRYKTHHSTSFIDEELSKARKEKDRYAMIMGQTQTELKKLSA